MSVKDSISSWFRIEGRGISGYAFIIHRLTGIVLTAYIFLHLAFLTSLTEGESAYTSLIEKTVNIRFLPFDILLIGVTIYHSLNGLRLVIAEFFVTRYHRELFVIFIIVGVVIWIFTSYLLYRFVVV